MRGIADQCEPVINDPRGTVEVERVAHPRRCQFKPAEHPAHVLAHFAQEQRIGHGQNPGGILFRNGPDQRRTMTATLIKQRQQGKGPGRIKDFPGDVLMALFVVERGHNRAMVIVPLGGDQSGLVTGRRLAALGGDQQAGGQFIAIVEHDSHTMLAALALDRLGPGVPGYRRFGLGRFEQGDANIAVGVHPAERAIFGTRLEIDPARLHLVGHRNRIDRATKWLKRVSQADIGEEVPAGGRNGGGTAIGPFGGKLLGRRPVHHVAGDPLPRRGEGQGHADQPTPQDDQVTPFAHLVRSQVLPVPASRSRQRPSKAPSSTFSPIAAARVGAISTVSTGLGCSNPVMPMRQNSIGTRRS